jgi:hypothetical protein
MKWRKKMLEEKIVEALGSQSSLLKDHTALLGELTYRLLAVERWIKASHYQSEGDNERISEDKA